MATTYLITNHWNGKMYVGFTRRSRTERFVAHIYRSGSGSNYPLHAAIRKYGPGAFTICTLGRGSIDDMVTLERIKIAELGTLAPNGYNLTEGGEHRKKLSDETRAKMSASAKKRAAVEDRTEQLQKAAKAHWSKPGAKERHIARHTGRRKPGIAERNAAIRARYEAGGVSQAALAEEFGISQSLVSMVLRGKR